MILYAAILLLVIGFILFAIASRFAQKGEFHCLIDADNSSIVRYAKITSRLRYLGSVVLVVGLCLLAVAALRS